MSALLKDLRYTAALKVTEESTEMKALKVKSVKILPFKVAGALY